MIEKSIDPGLRYPAGTVRMAVALPLPGLLRELGHDPEQILADLKFPVHLFDDAENRAPVTLLGKLAHDCARITDCPHFGLLLGERSRAGALGKIGFIAKYSADVGAALGTLVAHLPNNNDAAMLTLQVRGSEAALGFVLRQPDFVGSDQVIDVCMALFMSLMRELCGRDWRPSDVQLSHQPRADLRPYRRCFGTSVRFDTEQNAVVFDSRWLAHRLGHADPDLRALMMREIQQKAGVLPTTTAEQVRVIIRQAIGNGARSVAEVGKVVGLHPRTLNRRLAAEGTSFRELMDDIRYGVACQLLRETKLPIGQVATQLDFDEPSAFTRAFRRWSGQSPVEWRKQMTQQAAIAGLLGPGVAAWLAGTDRVLAWLA